MHDDGGWQESSPEVAAPPQRVHEATGVASAVRPGWSGYSLLRGHTQVAGTTHPGCSQVEATAVCVVMGLHMLSQVRACHHGSVCAVSGQHV